MANSGISKGLVKKPPTAYLFFVGVPIIKSLLYNKVSTSCCVNMIELGFFTIL